MAVRDVVVVGGSAGGIEAVLALVRGLPADLPAALFVVIHFPASAPTALPQILRRHGRLPAELAEHGASVAPGRIYVARPGCHLRLAAGRMWLDRGPKENRHRPAIDPLFRSAAEEYGPRVIGVVLSGGQNDGAAGLASVKRAGGLALVQDPQTAAYASMPQSAVRHMKVDHLAAPEQLAERLVELVTNDAALQEHDAMIDDTPAGMDEVEEVLHDRERQPGVPSTQTCPECHGTLWEVEDEGLLKFRCRVGHAYTAEALTAHQAEELEAALWTALRALEEHRALVRRLAARAADRGHSHTAASFTEQAMDAEHHASILRQVLQRDRSPATAAAGTDLSA